MNKKMKVVAIVALVAICCMALVACIPSNPEKAVENLKNAGYVVSDSKTVNAALALAGVKKIDTVVVGTNGKDGVTLVYFEDKSSANDAYKTIEDYAKKSDKESVIKKSGKVIYYGTEAGVKAVK